jgi:hypothetical protein
MELLAGRTAVQAEPILTSNQIECALVAALLHDCGYLKLRSDRSGTGAKYTFCHVLRSCSFASSYLPPMGSTPTKSASLWARSLAPAPDAGAFPALAANDD